MSDTTPVPGTPRPDTTTATTEARRRGRIGLIAGSVVGGVLVLALAFGGGTAVGWALGASHGGPPSMSGTAPDGQGGPGRWRGDDGTERGPGQPMRPSQREDEGVAPGPEVTPNS